ncbi:MAG: hypothetical protein KGD73_10895 [Candidatus Lokiarchaeota archaeon]|nr:hypothetical protein [Candidatus Lokiarchaeota archaeon]
MMIEAPKEPKINHILEDEIIKLRELLRDETSKKKGKKQQQKETTLQLEIEIKDQKFGKSFPDRKESHKYCAFCGSRFQLNDRACVYCRFPRYGLSSPLKRYHEFNLQYVHDSLGKLEKRLKGILSNSNNIDESLKEIDMLKEMWKLERRTEILWLKLLDQATISSKEIENTNQNLEREFQEKFIEKKNK